MNFLSRAIQKMRGYEAVAADAPPQGTLQFSFSFGFFFAMRQGRSIWFEMCAMGTARWPVCLFFLTIFLFLMPCAWAVCVFRAISTKKKEFMIDGQSCSEKEYRQLKQKTIRIIQAIPVTYLSRDKADAAIDALRTGRCARYPSSNPHLHFFPFPLVYDSCAYRVFLFGGTNRTLHRDPTDEHLFDEVWDAAMKHRDDLHAQKTA
nr:hypothetical protein [Pandoravirus aubagnensis]